MYQTYLSVPSRKILELVRSGTDNVTDISTATNLTKSYVSKQLDKMVDKDLVSVQEKLEREFGSNKIKHKVYNEYKITETGKEVLYNVLLESGV